MSIKQIVWLEIKYINKVFSALEKSLNSDKNTLTQEEITRSSVTKLLTLQIIQTHKKYP